MYLDDDRHVQWDGIGPYSAEAKVLAFITKFPGADMSELRKAVPAELRLLKGLLSGEFVWTINGVRQPMSEADVARTQRELEDWKELDSGLKHVYKCAPWHSLD